eukprot:CAMPEP_0174834410 /NCGR_PEP_ID=MMETSP1114-20130205/4809_1 /TAXON_ID=312471 /ORGANISM="Neobodo designis, Strain CCAP 1951/1" /LENGTH=158 /DNA_ID=CAMNT_0016068317 /DNA_START=31 /DNA_END=504 /DNA_ORIENTATION=+
MAISVTQEPLRVALGTFRPAQLAELTHSAQSHLPTLVQAVVHAFDTGDGIELLDPAPANLVQALNSRAMGVTAKGSGTEEELPPPASGVRLSFVAFSTSYDVTLSVKPCPDDAKDPFVWTLVMDLYRAMMRSQTQLRASENTTQRLKEVGKRQSPPRR